MNTKDGSSVITRAGCRVRLKLSLNPGELLEVGIGIGNGFVSRYLRDRGVNVTTLDIDKDLKPDVVGAVLDIPFPKASFQVVMCRY